jgi:hypothetical protein
MHSEGNHITAIEYFLHLLHKKMGGEADHYETSKKLPETSKKNKKKKLLKKLLI